MKITPTPPVVSTAPSDDVIRDYAFHLYEQSGRAPGRDLDNWQEATACLNANIPAHRSHHRLHNHAAGVALATPSAPSVKSKRV
jgi:Protein of unknown function (DUF2934)